MVSPHALLGLNKEQLKAVLKTGGPMLILAGAGSGKTKTLIHKIAYLISEGGCGAEKILAVTFTNKAAQELKDRLNSMLSGLRIFPLVGTFHSICARFLKEDIHLLGFKNHFNIYDEDLSLKTVKQAQLSLDISPKEIHPEKAKRIISSLKNELISEEEYYNDAQKFFDNKIAQIYEKYQSLLKANNVLDFDDLIMKTVELWQKYPDVLEKYQDKYTHLFIDEYQDTNHSQYVWATMLAGKHKNICVVGDDAQAIYGFRGANYRNILNFERDWKEAEAVKLEQNYRSTQEILNIGNEVILRNKDQKQKSLWTEKTGHSKPKVYEVSDESEEANLIFGLIKESKASLNDCAVLYRTNAQSRAIEEVLIKNGLPYRLVGGVRFYERKEIKDIIAYLNWALNSNDSISFSRILNEPPRGLGDKSEQMILARASETGDLIAAIQELSEISDTQRHKRMRELLRFYRELAFQAERSAPDKLIDLILKKTGYEDYLRQKSDDGDFKSRVENINELKTVAQKFLNLKPKDALQALLSEVALLQDIDNWNPSADALTLMTIHASKGLEFSHVFIAGLEEGLLPHANSFNDPSELEEERRLCYVAVTRARNDLTMTFARQRKIFGLSRQSIPSRFLLELPEDIYDFHSTLEHEWNW